MIEALAVEYERRLNGGLTQISEQLAQFLADEILEGIPRIDRISARAKSLDRFVAKATKLDENNVLKYKDPLNQIQDQIGARVVTFYKSDLDVIFERLQNRLRPIETRDVVPESEWEFGYFGRHYIFLLPNDVVPSDVPDDIKPRCFEMQVKTLFQHAWSEANHDLGYKMMEHTLDADDRRRLAYTSAQAWGADHAFDELFRKTVEQ